MEKPSKYLTKVLERSFRILETLLQQSSLINIIKISKKLKIYPSNILCKLDSFKSKGYLEQELHNQKYQLKLKLAELGTVKFHQINLGKEALFFSKSVNQLPQ